MKATAGSSTTKYTVRLLFVISLMQLGSPAGGMSFDEKGAPKVLDDSMANYMQSKVGGSYLADYFANGLDKDGILSLVSARFFLLWNVFLMWHRACTPD
jgi:retinol dehydrogenase-12